VNSGCALFDVMANAGEIEVKEHLPLEVEGADRDELIVNWLRELLYLYQAGGYLLKEFKITEVKDTIVKAEVCGEKIDPDRHEIKRNRYRGGTQGRVEDRNQWVAQVIFELLLPEGAVTLN
jgi:SHS2 domain-containing protein